jgi:hypothetical protein
LDQSPIQCAYLTHYQFFLELNPHIKDSTTPHTPNLILGEGYAPFGPKTIG